MGLLLNFTPFVVRGEEEERERESDRVPNAKPKHSYVTHWAP